MTKTPASSRRPARVAVIVIASLIVAHLTLALVAVHGKSATADEPLHAVAGWTWLRLGDFRLAPRDPPLFGYWQAIASPRDALKIDLGDRNWKRVPDRHYLDWIWAVQTLYRTPGNDADAFIWRGRVMMVVFDALLGILLARWAYEIGGATAAIIATTLFAFDPNFLAHGALIKNDVAVTCGLFACAWITLHVGRRGTWLNLISLALIVAVTCNLKFSGLIALPIVALVLLTSVALDPSWTVLRWSVHTRARKGAAVILVLIPTFLFVFASIWALYQFRYEPTPDPKVNLNFDYIVRETSIRQLGVNNPMLVPATRDIDVAKPDLFVRTILAANARQLMPQAWLAGLLYTYQSTISYQSFLLGDVRSTGWWYYFPLTIAFKSSLATLAACGFAGGVLLRKARRGFDRWTVACIAIPFALYWIEALRTHTNLGIRHILPILPFAFLATACVIANAWRRSGRIARGGFILLGIALIGETLAAFPNYIDFFNLAAGGSRGGIRLLADSNLDWGQDLPALAKWRRSHNACPLYLSYFGMADPAYYGIDFTKLPIQDSIDPHAIPILPEADHGLGYYIAISATDLQGVFLNDDQRRQIRIFIDHLRFEGTLNGTIYIFHRPPLGASDD